MFHRRLAVSPVSLLVALAAGVFASAPAASAAPDFAAAAAGVRELLVEMVAANPSNPPGNEARVAALGAASLTAQEFRARQGSTVTLGARVQAQFEASGSEDTPSSFFIRRAWVTIDGRLNDWVSARAQYDINGDKVLEAYLALNASDNVQFQLGQFKRAISTFSSGV